jgi:hypothetical protein
MSTCVRIIWSLLAYGLSLTTALLPQLRQVTRCEEVTWWIFWTAGSLLPHLQFALTLLCIVFISGVCFVSALYNAALEDQIQ